MVKFCRFLDFSLSLENRSINVFCLSVISAKRPGRSLRFGKPFGSDVWLSTWWNQCLIVAFEIVLCSFWGEFIHFYYDTGFQWGYDWLELLGF